MQKHHGASLSKRSMYRVCSQYCPHDDERQRGVVGMELLKSEIHITIIILYIDCILLFAKVRL